MEVFVGLKGVDRVGWEVDAVARDLGCQFGSMERLGRGDSWKRYTRRARASVTVEKRYSGREKVGRWKGSKEGDVREAFD